MWVNLEIRQMLPMNSLIKLSIVEPSGLLYGSELALLDILERLDLSRFAPEVILPRYSPFSERLRAVNIPYQELLLPMAHQTAKFRKAWTYLKLAVHWRRHPPDLIYVNQGGILRPMAAIARHLNLPILCQVQTLEDARWVSGLPAVHQQVCTFVCNSRFIRDETKVPAERISLLYYGYKPKGLTSKSRVSPQHPLQIGLLGRICENKGHYLLLEIARRLKQANSCAFHFRFIGDAASAAELKRIQDLVTAQGLDDLIEFRGYRTDIRAELATLDLLAIPSLAEPLGRILFEAAEARLPVLVSDGGGLGEVARHFRVGCLFRSGSADDFLDKLNQVHARYESVAQEFAKAAERMLAALDLGEYVGVMEQLLTGAAARQAVSFTWLGAALETGQSIL